jgi:hypothetical protein
VLGVGLGLGLEVEGGALRKLCMRLLVDPVRIRLELGLVVEFKLEIGVGIGVAIELGLGMRTEVWPEVGLGSKAVEEEASRMVCLRLLLDSLIVVSSRLMS